MAKQTGLDEKTVQNIFNARVKYLSHWHRFETSRILGIDEQYLNQHYRSTLTNTKSKTLIDLLTSRRQKT